MRHEPHQLASEGVAGNRERDVKAILNGIAGTLDELDDMKEILHGLIDRVVFDFSELDCYVHYSTEFRPKAGIEWRPQGNWAKYRLLALPALAKFCVKGCLLSVECSSNCPALVSYQLNDVKP